MDPIKARRRCGMVFQRPSTFPTMSIADNVVAGYKLNGIHLSKQESEEIVQTSLENVGLWNEVKDSLKKERIVSLRRAAETLHSTRHGFKTGNTANG